MNRKGWLVTFSGMGLNLALGVLYAWSVFGKQLTEAVESGGFGWTKTAAALPYTVSIAFFAAMMVPAGHVQDKYGPRIVAMTGAILTGLGLIMTGFSTPDNIYPALFGFGVLAGTGIGLGYAAATPAAVKWFPPAKKGLIAGIVLSGFGLASVYIAPLSRNLLINYGINNSFFILGAAFTIITFILARFIVNPDSPPVSNSGCKYAGTAHITGDHTWREMMRTSTFYLLWVEFACGSLAGLMIIGHLAKIVAVQSGGVIQFGFLFVAILAIFNAGGRILAGLVSDRIGRLKTILFVCVTQAVVMFLFSANTSVLTFLIGSAIVGFSYGACLSLFPSVCSDYWGTRNLGLNYGILFTAWGVGGVFGPLLAGMIADSTGAYDLAYIISAALMILAAVLTFFTKAPTLESMQEKVDWKEVATALRVTQERRPSWSITRDGLAVGETFPVVTDISTAMLHLLRRSLMAPTSSE
ncbi:MAG: OFA family MFS transporter [Smithellaceae bacterium]|nr:OFA family MFS transporter [Smithellaceae bacterium]